MCRPSKCTTSGVTAAIAESTFPAKLLHIERAPREQSVGHQTRNAVASVHRFDHQVHALRLPIADPMRVLQPAHAHESMVSHQGMSAIALDEAKNPLVTPVDGRPG